MGRKNDFSADVKKALAERAGYVCSFPGCKAHTIGPSSETPLSSAKTGMACHIYAAADGPAARRVKPTDDHVVLNSIENGIWMCYKHGKLIDSDETTYTPSQLTAWRHLAEKQADIRHAQGREATPKELAFEPLAKTSKILDENNFMSEITNLISASAIKIVWGTENALAVRDLIVELARNALTHGKAKNIKVEVKSHHIQITDDGDKYSLSDLKENINARGGSKAISVLERTAPQVIASYRHDARMNIVEISFTESIDKVISLNPCSITLESGYDLMRSAKKFIEENENCGTIFLRMTSNFFSYSECYMLFTYLKDCDLSGREIAIITGPISQGVRDFIKDKIPKVRIIEIEELEIDYFWKN